MSPTSVKGLEGFHIRAAHRERLAFGRKRNPTGLGRTLAQRMCWMQLVCILHEMHRQTVTNFLVNRPIWELCAGVVRRRGSPIRPFWWDQPMDLDLARERGLRLLPVQGSAGPALVADDED